VNIVDVDATERVLDKLASKRAVDLDAVTEVLLSQQRRIFRAREGSYLALGQTASGRYLAVFFYTEAVPGGVRAWIATARDMDAAERRRYSRR
jgi:uncharacterized DUF497 family protein